MMCQHTHTCTAKLCWAACYVSLSVNTVCISGCAVFHMQFLHIHFHFAHNAWQLGGHEEHREGLQRKVSSLQEKLDQQTRGAQREHGALHGSQEGLPAPAESSSLIDTKVSAH